VNATMFSLVSAFSCGVRRVVNPSVWLWLLPSTCARLSSRRESCVSAPITLLGAKPTTFSRTWPPRMNIAPSVLTSQRQSEALHSAAASPNYFSVLSVTPQLGRTFEAGEDQIGQDHVVILSHDLWERRFGSDASVIGRTIRLNRNRTRLSV